MSDVSGRNGISGSAEAGDTAGSEVAPRFGAGRGRGVHHDVFVCHATANKPVADAVVATLEGAEVRCWIAPRDVVPGDSYAEDIVAAIEGSRLVIFVFSAHSNESPHVSRELSHAVNAGIPIVPFRIEDVTPSPTLEFFISGAHWLDAMTPPLHAHLRHLAVTARMLLGFDDPERIPDELPTGPAPAAPAGPGGFVRDHWRWIVAAAAGFVVILAVVAGVLVTRGGGDGNGDNSATTGPAETGLETEADEGTGTTGPGRQTIVDDLEVGQCYINVEAAQADLGIVEVVDCQEPHHAEVIALIEYPAGPDEAHPGDVELFSWADQACPEEYAGYAGNSYETSNFIAFGWTPSPEVWADLGQRTVICFVESLTGETVVGSARAGADEPA